jgi:hypothetical protein
MIVMPSPESPDDMHPVYLHLQVKLPAGKYSIRATTKGRRAVPSPTRYSRNGRIQESKNLVEVTLCFGIACHDLQGALYKLKSHGHATQSIIMSR